MKCKECKHSLLSIYYRQGAGGKEWVKIKRAGWCKYCKNLEVR